MNPPYKLKMIWEIADIRTLTEVENIRNSIIEAIKGCGFAVRDEGWGFNAYKPEEYNRLKK